MSKIALIALDLNRQFREDPQYKQFYAQSPEQQIDSIAARIKDVCEELKTKEPDSMWIVSFHENTIMNKDGSKAVPSELLEYYQQTWRELAQKYPNLTIVAGPITTKKHVANIKKIDKLLRHYALHAWIKEEELKSDENDEKDLLLMLEEESKLLALKEGTLESGLDVICNTCYIVSGEKVLRHDKIAPFNETTKGVAHEVFQPAKAAHINSLVRLIHPITKEPIDIAIEICREHVHGVFAKTNPDVSPLLHLILSNTIALLPQHLRGQYVLQLDAAKKPRLIVRDGAGSALHSVNLYQTNLLDKSYSLMGPLEELYPFEMRVKDKFMQFIKTHPQDDDQKAINTMFEKFSIEAYVQARAGIYGSNASLSLSLDNMLHRFTSDLMKKYGAKYLKQESDLVLWVNEMQAIIDVEKERNLKFIDYVAYEDAPLRDKSIYFEECMRSDNFDLALRYINQNDILQTRQLTIDEAARLIGFLHDQPIPENKKEESYRKIFANLKDLLTQPLSVEEYAGLTFFHALCQMNMADAVKMALPYCTNINIPAANGDTPLHVAVRNAASHELLKLLFEHGADARLPNHAYETPVSLAKQHHPAEARYIDIYPLDEEDLAEIDFDKIDVSNINFSEVDLDEIDVDKIGLDTTYTPSFFDRTLERKPLANKPLERLDEDKKPGKK